MKTLCFLLLLAISLGCGRPALVGAATQLVSAPDASMPRSVTANGNSLAPVFSRDGRFLVFTSEASNLVTNDHNSAALDVFVKELTSGQINLASVTPNGESGNGSSYSPTISSNGQFVAFLSQASNLVPDDTNGVTDVFVRDLVAGTTTLVSAAPDGSPADGESFQPLLSADGRIVCFASRASNLIANHKGGIIDLFVRDLQNGSMTLVGNRLEERVALNGDVQDYTISPDGGLVVFTTSATNILADTGPGTVTTAYLHNTAIGHTTRLTLVLPNGQSSVAPVSIRSFALSRDKQYLAIQTELFQIPMGVAGLSSPRGGTYLFDLGAGTNIWLNESTDTDFFPRSDHPPFFSADGRTLLFVRPDLGVSRNGALALNTWTVESGRTLLKSPATGESLPAAQFVPSQDGKRVAFISKYTDLLPNVRTTNDFQLYVFDLPSNTLRLVSVDGNGTPTGGVEYASPQFSPDGRFLAFQSRSPALVPDDRNDAEDIFLYDWEANRLSLVSAALPSHTPTSSSHGSSFIARGLSADGRYVLFASTADDLVPGDRNGIADLFVRDRVTGRTLVVNVNSDGSSLDELIIREAVLSANGRFVAFIADNHNLTRTQTQVTSKLYVRDVSLGQTLLASVNTNGLPGAGQPSQVGTSADGRYVVFVSSDARDLVPGIAGPVATVVRDLKFGKTFAVEPEELRVGIPGSAPSLSGLGGKVFSMLVAPFILRGFLVDATTGARAEFAVPPRGVPVMSYDGSRAAIFVSGGTSPALRWSNLPVGDWHDIPLPGDLISYASLSADGRFAVLGSQQRSPVMSEVPLLVELSSGRISRLDMRPDGQVSSEGNSSSASVDANAHNAAFRSEASDLVASDTNLLPDIFVRDLTANQTTLLSGGADGSPGNDFSFLPLISADGSVLVFSSWADNLELGDFNHAGDIFSVELPARPFSDLDGDKLDDLWELSNFGNLLRDGANDYDGDDATEAEEFVAGTSPINDLSVFRLTATFEANGVLLSWTTEPGRSYQLRSRETLQAPWQPLGDAIRGNGAFVNRLVAVSEARQQFYQIIVLP